MSYRLFALKLRPIWIACAIGIGVAGTLQGADPASGRRSIQFTEPKTDKVSTNVNELRAAATGLKNLESDLAKPLQTFNFFPQNSMGGVSARPITPPRVFSNQRARAQDDRRRNWAFSTPDEIMGNPNPEDIFNVLEFGEKPSESQSTIERYYERMWGTRSVTTNRLSGGSFLGARRPGRDWDEGFTTTNSVDDGLGNMERTLKQMIDSTPKPGLFTPTVAHSGFGDMFRFNTDREMTPESVRIQKEQQTRLENFKKIWAPAPPTAAAAPDLRVSRSGSGNLYSAAPSKPFGPAPGAIDSSVSGMPAPATPTPPKTQPPPPPKPQRQEFVIPRRPF